MMVVRSDVRCLVMFLLALLVGHAMLSSAKAQSSGPSAEPPTAAPATAPPQPAPQPAPQVVAPASPSQTSPTPTAPLTDEQVRQSMLAEAEKALAPRIVRPPADPTAAAAFAVLDKHCARCHQGGKLEIPAPAAALGNILRLDEIARQPHLVEPGNPDGSPLYLSMLRRLMPLVSHAGANGTPRAMPSPTEIDAVRSWIAGLPPYTQCRDRRFVRAQAVEMAMLAAAAKAGARASSLRFISLAHLYNACARPERLAAYRQGVVKLVNSLSWKPEPVPVLPIDEARSIFQLDIKDLGWLPEHWDRIMTASADPLGLMPEASSDARRLFATDYPIVRADWLAATVLRAPLYYDVLGLPGTGPEILKILQVDIARLRLSGGVERYVAKPSRFSSAPSLIERLNSRTGPLWTAFHVIARDEPESLSDWAAKPPSEPIPHHASRMMFTLPNGLNGFAIVGQRGDRLDELPPDIALRTSVHEAGAVRAGLDCFACHSAGPTPPDPASPGAVAATDVIARQRADVAASSRRLGLMPTAALDGVEPLALLAKTYSRPLGAIHAAAEIGVELADLMALSDASNRPVAILARRLLQGVVPRGEVEEFAGDLLEALGQPRHTNGNRPDATPASGSPATTEHDSADRAVLDPGPGLILYSDRYRYKQGDALQLTVKAASDCHLTLISIDQRGRGTVIYPSDFETSTLLTAGQEINLPGQNAPYAFRLNEKGRERIVGLCNEVSATTDAITHDFERQRFTDLGNYGAYLAQHATGLGADAEADGVAQPERRQRGRRRRAEPTGKPARPEQISRTGITIIIE